MNKLGRLVQKYSELQMLVVVLLVVTIGTAGWLSADAARSPKTGEATNASRAATVDTASWQRVTSANGAFSIKVPDGWNVGNVKGSNWMVAGTDGDSDLAYEPGEPAEVRDIARPSGGITRFAVMQYNLGDQGQLTFGDEVKQEIRVGDVTGTRYYKQFPVEPSDGQGQLPGEKAYVYEIKKNGKTTYVFYNVLEANEYTEGVVDTSDVNRLELIDSVVQTLEVY